MQNISTIIDLQKRKVLVVEDEMINREILGMIISNKYEPIFASNGKEALDILNKNEKISIILLDLLMPVMDGYQFLKEVENTPFSRIPIIVLTSEKSAEIEALKLGAQDFIVKPYDMPEIILARIDRSIKLSEESEMIEKTARDSLTKLFTKKYFFEYVEEFNQMNKELEMDAVAIDIRRFHLINEIYGHSLGDRVLVSLATALKDLFEEYQGIVSRVDADVFYLYIAHSVNHFELYDRVFNSINNFPELKGFKIDLMVGINPLCDKSLPAVELFDVALRTCRSLRDDYSTNIKFYDRSMKEKDRFEQELLLSFESALENKEFKVYLQPKMNIQGDQYVLAGAEALVRWISPTYGFISPGTFIPLLENNGFIYKLDKYIWSVAAETISKWKKEFNKSVPISVNVSRIDILSPNFLSRMDKIIQSNNIDYKDLHLEVTESAYSSQTNEMLSLVDELSKRGFEIEIDDFGTGYSSLSLITSMSFDIMKIDMGFVRNMFKSENDMKVIEMLVEIAKTLNKKVVAEGVEEEKQVQVLKELGCDLIQGYFFSKPLPIDEFNEKYMK